LKADRFIVPRGSRAVIYVRVSTGDQAKNELSLPDQRKHLKAYCKEHSLVVSGEYSDAKSGRTDKRPGFQEMLNDILSGHVPCDVVVVHSFSRFFRDNANSELTMRTLLKHKIHVVSATQPIDESPQGRILRQFFALFDEYQSLETSKHVVRSMHENALQGFFNGGVTPFGYRSVETEKRGSTSKKKLELDPEEATVMRLIFDLALKGDGDSGPMGMKNIVKWLNDRGYRTRSGKRWGLSTVHRYLNSKTYVGKKTFTSSLGGGHTIELPVTALISEDEYDRLQEMLEQKRPTKTPPRVVTGDVLLTGLATCPSCGSNMTTTTGKSGRYRYYSCANRVRTGACKGRRLPMEEFDALVEEAILEKFLTVENIDHLLEPLRQRQDQSSKDLKQRIVVREEEALAAKRSLDNLISLVKARLEDPQDEGFQEHYREAKEIHKQKQRELSQVAAELSPESKVTHARIVKFVRTLRTAIEDCSIGEKRSYLWSFIDNIEVGEDLIRIRGRRVQIEKAVVARQVERSAVPTFVREWRWERDWRRTFSDLPVKSGEIRGTV
jgi:DNA invertase Pin-like site-specific DNA recombinase/PHD/YefM family antitoxin component YafN of YafNO toxin-antitoxin module